MKTLLAFCLILVGIAPLYSQELGGDDDNKVFMIVQTPPKFPGDVNKYLCDSINYPNDAEKNNAQGTVYVSFVVEKDGSVSTVKILRGSNNASLDKEAVRVVTAMPKWTAGQQNGHTVRVLYTVPICFVLSGNNSPPKHIKN